MGKEKSFVALVVDDTFVNQLVLTGVLNNTGLFKNVLTANDGSAGIRAFQKSTPDIVFMDYAMPGMDGLEASSEILKINPKAIIVMATASELDDWLPIKAKKIGIQGFLTKPINASGLKETVVSLLDYEVEA